MRETVAESDASGDTQSEPVALGQVVPYPWLLINRTKTGKAIERATVRLTGFSLQSFQVAKLRRQPYSPVALLTTVGRRSGLLRTVILPYVRFGDALVVVGSLGGGPKDPQWVHNLRAESRCWITVRRRMSAGDAVIAEGAERRAALDAVLKVRPFAAGYEQRSATFGRLMPIVLVKLRSPGARDAAPPA
jgi:deazaflavin-dependent oxidoreductase (nitroreductase family)